MSPATGAGSSGRRGAGRYRGFGRRYRGVALLTGLIVLGWLWDLALGGGRTHAAAWLGALVLVGGISLLAARGAAEPATGREPSTTPEPSTSRGPATGREPSTRPKPPTSPAEAPTGQVVIEPATPADLPRLIEVEVAADTLFEVAGYGSTPGPAGLDELASALLLLVARPRPGDPPVGYLRVELVDGQPHIESLSVRPKQMRRGVGTALVTAACQWAVEQGYRQVTLCTFADVPWNGPFYARLGFVEIPAGTARLRELRQQEEEVGLDAMGRRCVMLRALPACLPIE